MKHSARIAAIGIVITLGVLVYSRIQIVRLKMDKRALSAEVASLKADISSLKDKYDKMTSRYEEEYADRTAIMKYFSSIPKRMDFSKPFGFSLREKIDKTRILPGGIYIKEGDYEGFETGEMVVDKDTMAFAKISGFLDPEKPFTNESKIVEALKLRIKNALAANKYPFEVSYDVKIDNGRLEFSIIDVETYKKMEAREQKSFRESAELMKSYRKSSSSAAK